MRERSRYRRFLIGCGVVIVLGGIGAVVGKLASHHEVAEYHSVPVSRANVQIALTAPGSIEAVKRTEIRCTLEELPVDGMYVHGINILEMLPEGTHVKKGDIICRLDDSRYQELIDRQKIRVLRDESDYQQILLTRDAAAVALNAYRKGEATAMLQDYQGQIALVQADLKRAKDQLEWTRTLQRIGYVTRSQVASALSDQMRFEVQLVNIQNANRNFQEFVYPRTIRQLQIDVESKDVDRIFYEMQLKRSKERLEHYEELARDCIIKAPHDGVLVYASQKYSSTPKLEQLGHVHYGMRMFYLPDLSKLITQVRLHETVAPHVTPGMEATVRLESLPDRIIHGKVVSIDPVPTQNFSAGLIDIRQFCAQVELLDPPDGTLPDMTAEARIVTNQSNALVVPAEALAVEDGSEYCYVVSANGLERRRVELEPADEDRLCVLSGLSEGEQVVLDPAQFQNRPDDLIRPMLDAQPPAHETTQTTTPPAHHPA